MGGILESLEPPALGSLSAHTKLGLVALLTSHSRPQGDGVWSGVNADTVNWRATRSVVKPLVISDAHGSVTLSVLQSGSGDFVLSDQAGTAKHACKVKSLSKVQEGVPRKGFSPSVWEGQVEMDGHLVRGTVAIHLGGGQTGQVVDVWIEGQVGALSTHSQFTVPAAERAFAEHDSGLLNPVVMSPMPGKVIKVCVAEDQAVAAGDPLVILEAMKMEHVVSATCSG